MSTAGLIVFAALLAPTHSAGQADEGRKIALIIAISDYGDPGPNPITGKAMRRYRNLNAKNDVPLIRGALEVQGFAPEHIHVVQDSAADADGIRRAFRDLVREAREGDVVVFHYSGHGHRMTNDNPDEDEEIDGYDELLVPYGAHDEFYEGYDGSRHIRDDEVGVFLAELRRKVGPRGNVTFFIDACHSGTATRGGEELAARGSEAPLGPPAGGRGDRSNVGTGLETDLGGGTRGGAARGGGDEELAPFAVFSAAAQRQVAYETYDVDGKTRVGSLTYALARTLPEAGPGTTYRTLLAEITRVLAGKVRQTPQAEGTIDAQLFSDRLTPQTPYVEVDTVLAQEGLLALKGGSLLGLNPGTRLVVHPVGTARPDPASAMAEVVVLESEPLEAVAQVAQGTLDDGAVGAWAFVTERSFGDLATRVQLADGLRPTDVENLRRVLGGLGIIEFVDERPDVVVAPGEELFITAYTLQDSVVLGRGAQDVVRAVEDFARNQYLRRLDFRSEDIQVRLEVAPVELQKNLRGRVVGCSEADWEAADASPKSLGGGQWQMAPGDAYRVRIANTGPRRAYVALLDLMPRGEIHVLRPKDDESPLSYALEPGTERDLGCYIIDEHPGHETLKLFATAEPQDFRAMFETRGTRAGRGGDLSMLEQVVSRSFSNTRSGEVGAPGGLATTVAVQIHVSEGREERPPRP